MARSPVFLLSLLLSLPLQALTLNGFTRFGQELAVNAATDGVVQRIAVTPGQRVARGDLLIQLDDRPHRARVAQARARTRQLKPALQTAELEFDRAQELFDRDSLSTVALQKAESRLAEARGVYEAALADQQLAEYALERTRIRAPLGGRVLSLSVGQGQYVNPDADLAPLLRLVQTQSMLAVSTLASEQWDPGLVGRAVRVVYRGQSFPGEVVSVGLQRVQNGAGLSGYELRVRFDTEHLIPADMPVSIEIEE